MKPNAESMHVSIMADEVVLVLKAAEGGRFLDCTLGGGGHSRKILEANPSNTVLACDRDSLAISRSRDSLAVFGSRIKFAKACFSEIGSVVEGEKFDGLLADLGLSTDQLFEDRGFSFRDESALDMRMDPDSLLNASHVVNSYSEQELIRVFKQGGLATESKYMARSIIKARPVKTTAELAGIASVVSQRAGHKKKVHPATLAFQAIRMEVNQELKEIQALLDQVPVLLKDQGRAAIISFHSGEDKLVARAFRKWSGSESAPAWWTGKRPEAGGTKGSQPCRQALRPSQQEVQRNPASRSARLRVFVLSSVIN